MAPTYKIALIQLYPDPLQPDLNFSKATEFIISAAREGAQLAVLPEYHLTNWAPKDPKWKPICAQWEMYLNKYRDLAREYKICIVPGTIVQTYMDEEIGEEQLHNIAYFISNDGEVLGRYQKKNIWHPERPHLTSSSSLPHITFSTPLGPIGLLICWDIAFPEAFRELIASGAKLIIIPTFWTLADCSPYGLSLNPQSEALFLQTTLTARAFENTCAVVFVNAGAPPGDHKSSYCGLSQVAMPFVGALGDETKESSREGMSIVDVDMQVVEEAEENYKVRADINKEGWHYTYRHQERGEGVGG